MNYPAVIVGILLAGFIIACIRPRASSSLLQHYSVLLATFPLYYLVFAVWASDFSSFYKELVIGALFWGVCLIPLSRLLKSSYYAFIVLGLGYLAHGFYDIWHGLLFVNRGTPQWWPEFCAVVDVILAGYLLYTAWLMRNMLAETNSLKRVSH